MLLPARRRAETEESFFLRRADRGCLPGTAERNVSLALRRGERSVESAVRWFANLLPSATAAAIASVLNLDPSSRILLFTRDAHRELPAQVPK